MAFVSGRLEPGIALVIRTVNLADRLKGADLCLTGEGAIDASSVFGKTAVGAGLPLVWVGLGSAFGVGVGAAKVEVGRPPITAAARAADRIQARIDQVDRDGAGRPTASKQAGGAISAPRQLRLAAQSQTIVVSLRRRSQEPARAR